MSFAVNLAESVELNAHLDTPLSLTSYRRELAIAAAKRAQGHVIGHDEGAEVWEFPDGTRIHIWEDQCAAHYCGTVFS